jgi:hypothetical protein
LSHFIETMWTSLSRLDRENIRAMGRDAGLTSK